MSYNSGMASAQEYIELGNNCFGVGEYERAGEYYLKAVEVDNKNPLAWCNLGVMQFRAGKEPLAENSLRKAVSIEPKYSLAWYNLAQICEKLGRSDEAAENYKKTIYLDPTHGEIYNELALTLKNLNRLEEVEDIFLRALAIEPNASVLYNNLGNVYRVLGKYSEAKEKYYLALTLDQNYANAWGNLGIVHKVTGQLSEAKECLEKAMELKPDQWDFYHNLGVVAQEEGLVGKAINYFEKSIELNPQYEGSYPCLYLSKRQVCDWNNLNEAENYLDKIKDEDPFTTIMRSEDPEQNFKIAKRRSEGIERVVKRKTFLFEKRKKEDKIRVGYFSNDLREHPIGQMVAPMFGLHDRSSFKVFIYSYGIDDGSTWRKEAEKGADKFCDVRSLGNPEIAELIYKDRIDILVDLTGYTMDNRLEVMAMRPAPIQVSYLGYPGTTGAGFFDYIIADKNLIKKSEEKWFSEKVVYMPKCYQINNPGIVIAKKKFSRKECGLPEKGMVIASFNQVYKLESELFDIWCRILSAVEGSVLWLWKQDGEAETNLGREAEKRGIDPKRIIWAERLPKAEHLARMSLADLALDTKVYGGHTTTTDSLIAGVPVITRYGTHFASRVSASILKTVDLSELVVDNLEKYEKLAISLASDPAKLKKLKAKITRKRLEKDLINPAKFVRYLDGEYEKLYNDYI